MSRDCRLDSPPTAARTSGHSRLASPLAAARTSSAARATGLLLPHRRLETTAAAAFGAAVLTLYLPVLRDLIAVWTQVTYYSFGFLVPLFSAYVAWDVWSASKAEPRPEPAGFLIIAAGIVAFAGGVAAASLTARTLSLPVVLAGLALATLGPALTRQLAFPIGFLAFMAPLPDGTLPALSLPLQQLAAFVAAQTLGALGVPLVREGLFLRLPSVTLHVTEACNGLRFLLAMLVIGVAFAGTTQARPLRRALIVLAALTVAIVANLARVTGTGIMAELWGARAAIGLPHIVWGKVVYAAALLPFAALVLVMRRRP